MKHEKSKFFHSNISREEIRCKVNTPDKEEKESF
jgi:hypothetical protein